METTYFPPGLTDMLLATHPRIDYPKLIEAIEHDLDSGRVGVATSSDWVRLLRTLEKEGRE